MSLLAAVFRTKFLEQIMKSSAVGCLSYYGHFGLVCVFYLV